MFCGGRGKISALVEKGKGPWQRNNVKITFAWNIFQGKEDNDKRRQENGQTWIFFSKIALFEHTLKNSTHPLLSAWSILSVHIRFTPSEEPKNFINWLFETMDIGPSSRTMQKNHLPWSGFTVHGVDRPLAPKLGS
jgi:hypothetical protein